MWWHTDPSIQEAETGGSLSISQPGLHRTLFQKEREEEEKKKKKSAMVAHHPHNRKVEAGGW